MFGSVSVFCNLLLSFNWRSGEQVPTGDLVLKTSPILLAADVKTRHFTGRRAHQTERLALPPDGLPDAACGHGASASPGRSVRQSGGRRRRTAVRLHAGSRGSCYGLGVVPASSGTRRRRFGTCFWFLFLVLNSAFFCFIFLVTALLFDCML